MIGMLVIQTFWDLREHRIPIIVTMIGAVIGMIVSLWNQRTFWDLLCAMIPGIICLGVGIVTREAIGYGDGFLLCAMGTFLSVERLMKVVLVAIMAAGICGLLLLIIGRKNIKGEMAFGNAT